MVAIVSGNGLGLERSSAWVLGSRGQVGSASVGRGGDSAYVNGANGNLVITRQDEFLIGLGPDISLNRTYNSQAVSDGDNNDNWRESVYRKIVGTNGDATIQRIDWDGSETNYTLEGDIYVARDGAGAYDTLAYNTDTDIWTWTDGNSRFTESYNQLGRLTSTTDNNFNVVNYSYNESGLITSVVNSNGEYTSLIYSGTLLTSIETYAPGGETTPTLVRTHYTYDGNNRLSTVTVDLSPEDGDVSDENVYVTTYTYDGSSNRVASIAQCDGSLLQISYVQVGSDYRVASYTQAVTPEITRTTSFDYSVAGQTKVIDPAGQATILFYDAGNRLTRISYPSGSGKIVDFAYNGNGDVTSASDGPGNVVIYEYDASGNLTLERDGAGNTVTRTYSAKNELLTETRFLVPDPDGAGSGGPETPLTTHFAYDEESHLIYRVGAEGYVTQYTYGYDGKQIAQVEFPHDVYDLEDFGQTDLDGWAVGKTQTGRVETAYDYRGAVSTITSYSRLQSSGEFDLNSELSQTLYEYDQAGNLARRSVMGSAASEVFAYDGLNRITSSTDFNGHSTSIAFNDAATTTVMTMANGLVRTSVYDLAGELLTYTESGEGVTTAATAYRYDGLGRLRMTIDAAGHRDFFHYDAAGRLIGEIDSDGSVVEYRYDGSDNLTSSTAYATRATSSQLGLLVDGSGNPTEYWLRPGSNVADRWTWQVYDDAQRLIRTIDGTGAITAYAYDGASRLTATTQYATPLAPETLAALKADAVGSPAGVNLSTDVDGQVWAKYRVDVGTAGTLDGASAFQLSLNLSGLGGTISQDVSVAAGDTVSFSMSIMAVGTNTADEVAIRLNGAQSEADLTGSIDFGPGSIEYEESGVWLVSGLSTTVATRFTITRHINTAGFVRPTLWIGDNVDPQLGMSTIVANPEIRISRASATSLPEADSTNDRTTRNFYDGDGRLIATLDGEGYLTETFYDAAGHKSSTVAYANATDPDDRAGESLDVLRDSFEADDARDVRNYFVYDARNMLRATVDGEGDLTRYRYTPLGEVDQIVTGQKLDPSALAVTPPTFATLPTPATGTLLQTTTYTRNLYGQILSETRSLTGTSSTTTVYAYDKMGRLVSTTTQSGGTDPRTFYQRYDARGRLKTELSGIGGVLLGALAVDPETGEPEPELADPIWIDFGTSYAYDADDRLIATTDPDGRRAIYYYNSDDQLAYQVNSLGETVEYRYDAFGERTDTLTYAARIDTEIVANMTGGSVADTSEVDIAATVAALANASVDSHVVDFYDNAGRLKLESDQLGTYTKFAYNSFGQLTRRNVAFGESPVTPGLATEIQTDFDYDRRGFLRSQLVDSRDGGLGIFTSYGRDAFGREAVLTDPGLNTTTRTYDRAGRLTAITDALDHSTTFTYDALGNLVAVTDADENVTRYVYDLGGRQIFAIDARGGVVATSYDDDGRVLATRSYATEVSLGSDLELAESDVATALTSTADDRITRYAYDKNGRLQFTVEGGAVLTELCYDDAGNVVSTIRYGWAVSASSTYSVDALIDDVEAHASDPQRVERSFYDLAGRLVFAIDAAGSVTQFAYDSAGRVIKQVAFATAFEPVVEGMDAWAALVSSAGDRVTRAVYDQKGRLAYSIDGEGFVTEYRRMRTGEVNAQIRYAASYEVGDGATAASVKDLLPSAIPSSAVITEFYYDTAGRLYGTRDALGNLTNMVLDARGLVTSSTLIDQATASETTTLRSYDELGRLHSETRAAGADEEVTTVYDYNAVGDLITITYAADTTESCVTTRDYDALGRPQSETRATGEDEEVTTAYSYTAFGEVETVALASGTSDQSVTRYSYDEMGRIEGETHAFGEPEATTTLYGYTTFGDLETITTAAGTDEQAVETRTYDSAGRVHTISRQVDANPAHDIVTTNTYDAFGNLVKVTDARLNDSYFYYDRLGRLELQIDQEGFATKTVYDNRFDLAASVTRYWTGLSGPFSTDTRPEPTVNAAHDATTYLDYDKLGRLTKVTDAEGHYEQYTLDAAGNRIEVRNKLGGIVHNSFDRLNRLTDEVLPVTTTTALDATISVANHYVYDARGNRTVAIEAYGAAEERTTQFDYDKLDRLILTTHDAVSVVNDDLTTTTGVTPTEQLDYDRRGNAIEKIDAAGARTLAWYDDLGRVIAQVTQSVKISGADKGTLTRTTYDANGNAKTVTVYGDLVTLPSDATGSIPSPVDSGNYRLTKFDYDLANRMTKTRVDDLLTGAFLSGSYAISTSDVVTTRDYDMAGNVIHEEDGRGNDVYSWYDKLNRKTAQVDAENYLTTWDYDAEGNVTSETRFAAPLTSFTVPSMSAVTTRPSVGTSADDRTTSFVYDRNGHRTSEVRSGVAYTWVNASTGYGTDTTGNSTITYTYNGLGQVTSKTQVLDAHSGNVSDAVDYTYDDIGRLTLETAPSFTDSAGATVTPRTAFRYDGLGNLLTERLQAGAEANDTDDRVTTLTYGAGGRMNTMTDAAGFTHHYGYDTAGRLVRDSYERVLSDGTTSITEASVTRYDMAGRAVLQTFARDTGSAWLFTDADSQDYDAVRIRYNAYGDITGRGLTAGPAATAVYQETFDYDAGGRLWRSNAGDGVLRFYVYDEAGNQTLTLASAGADLSTLTLANYTASINTSGVTSGDTNITDAVTAISVFDKRGMQTQTREPDRQLTASPTALIVHGRTYNAFGEVSSETDPRGFDSSGNPISFSGGAGYTTTYAYNTMGRLIARVSPQVSVTAESGAISAVSPTEYYGYDLSGRMVSVTDANGYNTTRLLLSGTGHDANGEPLVTAEFHPDGGVARTFYDMFGDARLLRNELSTDASTTYDASTDEKRDYDKMGRVITDVHRGNLLTDHYLYDGLGQRTGHWNSFFGSVVVETTDYDSSGRIVSTRNLAGEETTYTYSWDSLAETAGMATYGARTKVTSTIADRASTSGNPIRAATETTDYFGRMIARTDMGVRDFSFSYDKAGRLAEQKSIFTLNNLQLQDITYAYYNSGQLKQSISGNKEPQENTNWARTISSFEYDADGRRVSEHVVAEAGEMVPSHNNIPNEPPEPDEYVVTSTLLQDGRATYDALGRMASYSDLASSGADNADITWEYDAAGNVRHMLATYRAVNADGSFASGTTAQDYWYRYDPMNRFVTTKGSLTADRGFGTIEGGATGQDIEYNAIGERKVSTSLSGGSQSVETYDYRADGYLSSVSVAAGGGGGGGEGMGSWVDSGQGYLIFVPGESGAGLPIIRSAWSRDALGRVDGHLEYDDSGAVVHEQHDVVYDNKNQVLSEQTRTKQGSDWIYARTTNTYGTTGLLDQTTSKLWKNGSNPPVDLSTEDYALADSTTNYTYGWLDGAVQTNVQLVNRDGTTYSGYSYDFNGMLSQVSITGGARPREIYFVNDTQGHVLSRVEADHVSTQSDPREKHYFFNGIEMGMVGNNGTTNTDYPTSIANRTADPGTGAFQNGAATGTPYADFDQSHDAINGTSVGNADSTYMVHDGETLQSIAQTVWGDAAMWYLIAEANGLNGSETLVGGTSLIVPDKVTNIHNNADTFRVYDPNKALGDTSPSTPKPVNARHGCGVVGAIMLVAIAVAVAVVTSGAALAAIGAVHGGLVAGMGAFVAGNASLGAMVVAGAVGGAVGSAVSQGVGVATGLQDKFSWKGVAMAGIAGGIAGGLGKFGALAGAGKVGMTVTETAEGITKSFNALGQVGRFLGGTGFVAGAARGAVSSSLAQGIAVATSLQDNFSWTGVAAAAVGGGISSGVNGILGGMNSYAAQLVSGGAGAIANAATRTVIDGSDFGDNILAALPDVIGNTIGNFIAGGIRGSGGPNKAELGDVPISLLSLPNVAGYSGPINDVLQNLPVLTNNSSSPESLLAPLPTFGTTGLASLGRVTYTNDPNVPEEIVVTAQRKARHFDYSPLRNGNEAIYFGNDSHSIPQFDYIHRLVNHRGGANFVGELVRRNGGPHSAAEGWFNEIRRNNAELGVTVDDLRTLAARSRDFRSVLNATATELESLQEAYNTDHPIEAGVMSIINGVGLVANLPLAVEHTVPTGQGLSGETIYANAADRENDQPHALVTPLIAVLGMIPGARAEVDVGMAVGELAPLGASARAAETIDIAHPLAGIAARDVVDMVAARGLNTQRDSLILWSGLGRDGPVRAQAFAREFGGTTLEMTPGGKWLDSMDLYGAASPYTRAEADMIWGETSARLVGQASGQVRSVLGQVRPGSVYRTYEMPALQQNPAILGLDPLYLRPMLKAGGY